jgi:hypothetical protein
MNEELDSEAVILDTIISRPSSTTHPAFPKSPVVLDRVVVKRGSFAWKKDVGEAVIKDISLTVTDGMLLSIVGV